MSIDNIDLLNDSTIAVCEAYLKGELEVIPENHIFVMLKALTYGRKRYRLLGMQDPSVRAYVKTCMSDMEKTVRSYLQLKNKKSEYRRAWYLKHRTPRAPKIHSNAHYINYYEAIEAYKVGAFDFQGYALEIYYDVPVQTKHDSLTCFHTNPITLKLYYFKNMYNILPCEELKEQFRVQFETEV